MVKVGFGQVTFRRKSVCGMSSSSKWVSANWRSTKCGSGKRNRTKFIILKILIEKYGDHANTTVAKFGFYGNKY